MIEHAPSRETWLQVELIRHQFRLMRAIGLGSLATLLFLLLWFGPQLDGIRQYYWLIGLGLVRLTALGLTRGFEQLSPERKLLRGRLFVVQNLVSGFCWAWGAWIIFRGHDPAEQWMFVAVFCGIGAGATTAQAAVRGSAAAFVLPAMITMAALLPFEGNVRSLSLLLLLPIYGASLVLLHRSLHRELAGGLLSRYAHEHDQRTLREQSEKLSALLRLKEFFIAAASHDLRQPAQAVQLLARSVHESCQDDSRKDMTGALLRASDQVTDLINRLLDLARLDLSGDRARPDWLILQDVLGPLETTLQVRARQTGVALTMRLPAGIELRADPLFLTRILQNLLLNAIEHAHATEVTLEARVPAQGSAPLELIVRDDGTGIDAASAQLIDGPFRPLSIDSSAPSVRGLGLAIASRLAHLEGQKLSVNSQQGQGTQFVLGIDSWRRMSAGAGAQEPDSPAPHTTRAVAPAFASAAADPVSRASVQPAKPAASSPPRPLNESFTATARVLLIEDEPLVRLAMRTILHANRLAATIWLPGDPLPEPTLEPPLRLILADWQLGGGLTALDVLRDLQQKLQAPLPVIFLTGMPSLPIGLDEVSAQLGGIHVQMLQKPVDEGVLRRAIGTALAHPVGRFATAAPPPPGPSIG
ncbi:MAG: hybrid sensor histidine kinase/response regulator [Burkholderiaceae bacterium]